MNIVLPFGLTNAPSIFQALINDVLWDFINWFAFVYLHLFHAWDSSIPCQTHPATAHEESTFCQGEMSFTSIVSFLAFDIPRGGTNWPSWCFPSTPSLGLTMLRVPLLHWRASSPQCPFSSLTELFSLSLKWMPLTIGGHPVADPLTIPGPTLWWISLPVSPAPRVTPASWLLFFQSSSLCPRP